MVVAVGRGLVVRGGCLTPSVCDQAASVGLCICSCLHTCGGSERSLLAPVLTNLTQSGMEDEPQGLPQAHGTPVHTPTHPFPS